MKILAVTVPNMDALRGYTRRLDSQNITLNSVKGYLTCLAECFKGPASFEKWQGLCHVSVTVLLEAYDSDVITELQNLTGMPVLRTSDFKNCTTAILTGNLLQWHELFVTRPTLKGTRDLIKKVNDWFIASGIILTSKSSLESDGSYVYS